MRKKILSLLLSTVLLLTPMNSFAENDDTVDNISGTYEFEYTGSVQEFVVPETGKYMLEVIGADGGRSEESAEISGLGGHSLGYANLKKGEKLYIYVGQSGEMDSTSPTFNGGGAGTGGSGSGGGATDIRRIKANGSWYNTNHTTFESDASLKSRIIVAGGGGGESSARGGNSYAGQGGGNEGQRVRYYENFDQTVAYPGTQTSGYEFGRGENADSTVVASNGGHSGGGGGGWYGGGTGSLGDHGGAGGSGYIKGLLQAQTDSGWVDEKADGSAIIKYIGPVKTTLTLYKGNNGTWTYGSAQVKTITGTIGETITLPTVLINDGYSSFKGWALDGYDAPFTTWTFGMDDASLNAIIVTPLTLSSQVNAKDSPMMFDGRGRIHLNWAEASGSSSLTYEVFQSKNGSNYEQVMANGYPASANISTNFGYSGNVQTVVVRSNGWYTLRMVGGKGGNDIGTGGAGATAQGTFYFKKNDILYVYIGGPGQNDGCHTGGQAGGWNGGGSSGASGWSGTGGGASDVRLNSTDISARFIVAGGGGGASNGSFSGSAGNTGTHTGTFYYGGSVGGGDGGGGGGGYYGGYAGNDSSRGGGGGSNYIASTLNGMQVLNAYNIAGGGGGAGYGSLSMANTDKTIQARAIDLYTPDESAPAAIDKNSFETVDATSTTEDWQFNKPEDIGTKYWHYVRVKGATTEHSNVCEDVVTSGIKGYYYYIDGNASGTATKSHTFTSSTTVRVNWSYGKNLYYNTRYIHIAPVDNAGNLGPTTTYGMNIADSNLRYDIETNQIKINDSDDLDNQVGTIVTKNINNVYQDPTRSKTYFVKADSKFNLNYDGRTYPYARLNYMVNMMYYEGSVDSQNQSLSIRVGNSNAANPSGTTKNSGVHLFNYKAQKLTRTANLTTLNYNQEMSLDNTVDNKVINMVPKAEVYFSFRNKDISKSSRDNPENSDASHNINLVCDSKEPTITFNEKYDPASPSFNPLISTKTIIPIDFADYIKDVDPSNPKYGSGIDIKNVTVKLTQEQTDNGGGPIYNIYKYDTTNDIISMTSQDRYKGQIVITLDPEKYSQMSGFIDIDVDVIDNVGNCATKHLRVLIMSFTATIKNVDSLGVRSNPSVFAAGEQGQIILETNGFVDNVNIAFPESLDELARVEKSNNGTYNSEDQSSNTYIDYGRVLSDVYPRDDKGQATRVSREFQTKLWGTKHLGGMQYNGTNYESCYLQHFFYAPTYSAAQKYTITITVSKQDINGSGKVYEITKTLPLYIGIDERGNPLGNITTEFTDNLKDN